jgi:hypothetical protein
VSTSAAVCFLASFYYLSSPNTAKTRLNDIYTYISRIWLKKEETTKQQQQSASSLNHRSNEASRSKPMSEFSLNRMNLNNLFSKKAAERAASAETSPPSASSSKLSETKKLNKSLLRRFDTKQATSESDASSRASVVNKSKKNYNEWWCQVSSKKLNMIQHEPKRVSDEFVVNRKSSIKSEFDVLISAKLVQFKQAKEILANTHHETRALQQDIELFKSIDFVLDNFTRISDLNKRLDLAACLCDLSTHDFLTDDQTVQLMIKYVHILNTDYSRHNSDLFENYRFNNTYGELSTDIVKTLLQTILNLISTGRDHLKQHLAGSAQLTQFIVQLLYSYLIDLDKNKNNVKRLRKIESIKLVSFKILNQLLEFYLTAHSVGFELGGSCWETNCVHLLRSLLLNEPVLVVYTRVVQTTSSADKNSAATHLNGDEKQALFREYLTFIDKILRLFVRFLDSGVFDDLTSGIIIATTESLDTLATTNEDDCCECSSSSSSVKYPTLFKYLTSMAFYDTLQVYFQLAESSLNELIDPLFNYLVFIKDYYTEKNVQRLASILDVEHLVVQD